MGYRAMLTKPVSRNGHNVKLVIVPVAGDVRRGYGRVDQSDQQGGLPRGEHRHPHNAAGAASLPTGQGHAVGDTVRAHRAPLRQSDLVVTDRTPAGSHLDDGSMQAYLHCEYLAMIRDYRNLVKVCLQNFLCPKCASDKLYYLNDSEDKFNETKDATWTPSAAHLYH